MNDCIRRDADLFLKIKRIKTPLLAAEAFPIQKDSDSGGRKHSISAGLSKLILTGRGILPALPGALP
ncbi:hypothetical protein GG804_28960 [Sphingomonas histidinilytica]|uniref:Uncharacterized protein n=4 Tax=Sphingomonadaceae TaxID=41297 RepID=A0A2A4FNF4_9SPHN|nr:MULTISPECIES: hypothetical protein [Sphingomonadaceae]ARR57508.1 hypothetical protein HY78_28710 [Rhizorhabdus wittichii DC-6]MBY2930820.1 hypothetical protein [Sphingomonadales bacterium 56]MBY2960901.1 hypothetical protein [Sphingomonadales bacterium 58]QEH76681.1 hypothetical protein EIK56_00275 [Sphingomonas sp. C8-2]ATE67601.1 hypothetical protein CMV14_23935 [Rhizorhabdus dicambivorans]